MRLELTGRHVDITPSLRRLVDTKLARLERLLNDSAVSAQTVLTREKHRCRADVTVHARGDKFLHGVASSASWECSVGEAIDKIAQQAQRIKGKWQERKRRSRRAKPIGAAGPGALEPVPLAAPRIRPRMPRTLRASRQVIKPMSVTEAAREVEVSGDGVLVFRNVDSSAISVLYRRPNGELGLVETEL